MKNVCVPRFAVKAKYRSRKGVRIADWRAARYGVSHRTRGRSFSRAAYRHFGRARMSIGEYQQRSLETVHLDM